MSDTTKDIDSLVECIGNGTNGSGCGEVQGRSGYACGRCGGMLLSKTAVGEVGDLAAMRKEVTDEM